MLMNPKLTPSYINHIFGEYMTHNNTHKNTVYGYKNNKKLVVIVYICSLGSIVVSMKDSHSCDRGSSPVQGKHIYVML